MDEPQNSPEKREPQLQSDNVRLQPNPSQPKPSAQSILQAERPVMSKDETYSQGSRQESRPVMSKDEKQDGQPAGYGALCGKMPSEAERSQVVNRGGQPAGFGPLCGKMPSEVGRSQVEHPYTALDPSFHAPSSAANQSLLIESGIHSTVQCNFTPERKVQELNGFFGAMVARLRDALGWGEQEEEEEEEVENPFHTATEESLSKAKTIVAGAVDGEVTHFCAQYPEIAESNSIICIGGSKYLINGRECDIQVRPQHKGPVLMVIDGPLMQPFLDYFFNTGQNEQWADVGGPPLRNMPRSVVESAQDFDCCDRLAAMRAASHQAREKNAPNKAMQAACKPPAQPMPEGEYPNFLPSGYMSAQQVEAAVRAPSKD